MSEPHAMQLELVARLPPRLIALARIDKAALDDVPRDRLPARLGAQQQRLMLVRRHSDTQHVASALLLVLDSPASMRIPELLFPLVFGNSASPHRDIPPLQPCISTLLRYFLALQRRYSCNYDMLS